MKGKLADLRKFSIFAELDDRELQLIERHLKEVTYQKGSRFFEEKSLATNLYMLIEGKVVIKMANREVDDIEPGEIFGWSAVTEPYAFTAAAWAAEDTRALVVQGEVLRDIFDKNNHIGYLVMKRVASVIARRLKVLRFGSNIVSAAS